MKLRTGKTVRGGREPPLGERRTGASFLPFAEKRKRSQPQTFFTLQYFFTKPRGNAAGLCTPQRRLFKRKPPCGKRRRPICGTLLPQVTAHTGRKAHATESRFAESTDGRFTAHCAPRCRVHGTGGVRATRQNGNFAAARRHGGQALQSETATSRRLGTADRRNRPRRQAVQKSHPPPHNIAHSPKPHIIDTVQKTANVHNKKRLVSAIPQNALSTVAPRRSTRGDCLSFSFPSQTNYFLSTKTE